MYVLIALACLWCLPRGPNLGGQVSRCNNSIGPPDSTPASKMAVDMDVIVRRLALISHSSNQKLYIVSSHLRFCVGGQNLPTTNL